MKNKNIYLVRHGETDWNREQRFQGQTDIPLNQLGREQAQVIIPMMSRLKIEAIFSSTLSRAIETAQIANSDLKIEIQKDSRLRETNVGEAEGMTFDQLEQKFGSNGISRWRSYDERDLDFKYTNGESKREMMFRIREVILEIAQNSNRQNIAVFAHGMVMRCLTFVFQQGVPWDHQVFANGSIHHFSWDESRPEYLKYHGKISE
jgi:broad specificity phosphatase PhoE